MQKVSFLLAILTFPLFAQQVPEKTEKEVQVVQGDVEFDSKRDASEDDMEALRRWIRDKRLVTVKEIGGDLSLSGEVRTEFQDTSEVLNGNAQRGHGLLKPQYAWDVEVNIMIDYRTERTWAAIKVEFDNDMGVRSGTLNRIRLEKGYAGGRIVAGDTFTMDAEIGRRFLFNVFESKVEFSSLFDGVLFRFSKAWPQIGDFYVNAGALLVDDKVNHYAYIMEIGGLRIANTGLNLKLSTIDWYKPFANELNYDRYKYVTTQLLAAYQIYPEWIGKKLIKFYAAGLANWLASPVIQTGAVPVLDALGNPIRDHGKLVVTGGEKQNWAWYAGLSIGLVKKQYDWAVDANYQWVQAQSVAEFDCSGIGRGNAAGVGLYTVNADGNPSSGATTRLTAVGSTNYHGFEIEGLYAITDNLTVLQNFKYSTTLNKSIGPNIIYKQYEMEFIYAF